MHSYMRMMCGWEKRFRLVISRFTLPDISIFLIFSRFSTLMATL